MKTIVFIESKEDIYKAQELYKNNQATIIALDPSPAYELEKLKIPHKTQDDYFSWDDYIEVARFNLKRVKEFCDTCDGFLKNNAEFLNANNLNFAFYHFSCFRTLFDIIGSKAALLKKIIEAEKPDNICFFDNDYEEKVNENFRFAVKSPYSEVLRIISSHYNISRQIYRTKGVENYADYSPITYFSENKNIIKKIYNVVIKIFNNFFKKYKNLPVIFMTSPGYNLFYLCEIVKKSKTAKILSFNPESTKDPYFIFPSTEEVKKINCSDAKINDINFEKIWQELLFYKKFRGFFTIEKVNILPAVEKHLKYFFTVFIKDLINLYLKGTGLFARYKPKIFLAPYIVRARMKILAEAAKRHNVPVAVYQHGGVYGYIDYIINDDIDLQYCDYFIAFGDGIKLRYENCRSKVIPVGSFVLNKLANPAFTDKAKLKRALGIEGDKKIVIYAMSAMYGKMWKYIDYFYYTDHESFKAQRKIIDIFSKHNNCEYILKIFPTYAEKDPIVSYINDQKKKNFKIVTDKSFKEILPCADMIVLDSSSTALLEALTTKKKLMVYDLYKSMFPDAVEVLRKRAYYTINIDEYASELDRVLKEEDFFIGNPDNEFSKLYGNYDNYDEMSRKLQFFLAAIAENEKFG